MKKTIFLGIICFVIGGIIGIIPSTVKASGSGVYNSLRKLSSVEIKLYASHPIDSVKAKNMQHWQKKKQEKDGIVILFGKAMVMRLDMLIGQH